MGKETQMGQALRIVNAEEPELGLHLPKGQSFDDWVQTGRNLASGHRVLNWWIGDWWAAGSHRYGARAAAAAEGIFGREFDTLAAMASVCRAFETCRRRQHLSFTHHREAAALAPDQADALLDQAEAEGFSTRDLRRAVMALRTEQAEARRSCRGEIDIRPADTTSDDVGLDGTNMSEMIVELAESLSRERALTERESQFLEHALRIIARRYPASIEPWTAEEELRLVDMLRNGERPKQIAPQLNRTVGALWRRINKLGGIGRIVASDHEQRPVGRLGLMQPEQIPGG